MEDTGSIWEEKEVKSLKSRADVIEEELKQMRKIHNTENNSEKMQLSSAIEESSYKNLKEKNATERDVGYGSLYCPICGVSKSPSVACYKCFPGFKVKTEEIIKKRNDTLSENSVKTVNKEAKKSKKETLSIMKKLGKKLQLSYKGIICKITGSNERKAIISDNIARLKSKDDEIREAAALEAHESMDCWWDQRYYTRILPVIFDNNPSVRQGALKSLRTMLYEDYSRNGASTVMSVGGLPSSSYLENHFLKGKKAWQNSAYYPINKKIVNDIKKLLNQENNIDVKEEAELTLRLAQSFL